MILIGLHGKMGSGKSTVAKFVKSMLGVDHRWDGPPTVKIISFADPIKTEVALRFNIPLVWCYNDKDKLVHERIDGTLASIRELLQTVGQAERIEAQRQKARSRWTVLTEINVLSSNALIVIIDDVRFPEEMESIRKLGGRVIKVRPYTGWNKYDDHESETALDHLRDDQFDHVLKPQYGLVNLNAAAQEVVRYIKHFAVLRHPWPEEDWTECQTEQDCQTE
jgi:hypothetical protein